MSYIPEKRIIRTWKNLNYLDYALLCAFVFFLVYVLFAFIHVNNYSFDYTVFYRYFFIEKNGDLQAGPLLQGLFNTIRIGLWSMFFSFLLGSFIGILSAHKKGFSALPFQIYTQFFRNLPPLILLFILFFFVSSSLTDYFFSLERSLSKAPVFIQEVFYTCIAPKGQLDRILAVILTLSLYEGAYIAEIVRAGIESVPKEQWEASKAQGFNAWQTRRYIILPQAFYSILPPALGIGISIFKDSALASIISVPELTFQSLELMAVSRKTFEIWLCVGILYYSISFLLEFLGKKLELRKKW